MIYSRDVITDESEPGILEKETPEQKKLVYRYGGDFEDDVQEELQLSEEKTAGRPARKRHAPDRYGEWVYVTNNSTEPGTVREARASPDKAMWETAM